MKQRVAKIGLAGIILAGLCLLVPSVSSADEVAAVVSASCPSEASGALMTPAIQAETPEKALPMDLQNLFSPRVDCYTYRCRTNTECTQICGDVAKCCALESCYGGGPSGGHLGYCVLM